MDYLDAIQDAIAYVEGNLGSDLTLESAASRAGFSKYHFSRLFHLLAGERFASYVQERRLSCAAKLLLTSDRPIIDVAVSCGFNSHTAFTRSFAGFYGVTPSTYRKNAVALFAEAPRLSIDQLRQRANNTEPQTALRDIDGFRVDGLCWEWSVNSGLRLAEWWTEFGLAQPAQPNATSRLVGVCGFLPCSNMTVDSKASYLTGIETPRGTPAAQNVVSTGIPSGSYAVFTHEGRINEMLDTCRYIFGVWLPRSGLELRDAYNFAVYDPSVFDSPTQYALTEVYVPIMS